MVVTEEQMEIFNQRAALLDDEKKDIDTAKRIIEVVLAPKSKDGVFKVKPLATLYAKKNLLREAFHKVFKIKGSKDFADIREILLTDANNYRLFKKVSDSDIAEIYSAPIDKEKIKTALEKINAFTQAYFDFAVTPNQQYVRFKEKA